MHRIVIGFIKGVSADWWNYRHFRHHAKPNAHQKDPDIGFGHFLVLGKIIPRELGLKKKGAYSYLNQQNFFMMTVPPFLLPLVFTFENIVYCWKRRKLTEVLWIVSFFVRWFFEFGPCLGTWGAIKLYFAMRFFESYWFVFITQMNHLPMHVDRDRDLSWFRIQLITTCNVEQSFFNDWLTGHSNFQIEHHLFPTMPRHNYNKVKPYIKSLCAKYNIEYVDKPLLTAIVDIYRGLKESGELWYEAYSM
jgi:fatty acid desaturase